MIKVIYNTFKNNYEFSIYMISKKEYVVRVYEVIDYEAFMLYDEISTSTEQEAIDKLIELEEKLTW